MPIDSYGRYFISYRRTRAQDIGVVREALRHLGVPTWLDTADLRLELTNDELRRVIADPETSGAILFASPDVRGSTTICEIELPAIMARKRSDPGFKIIVVAFDGVDYADLAGLYGEAVMLDNLGGYNTIKVNSTSLSMADATPIAERALRERLSAIVDQDQTATALQIMVNSREPLPWSPGIALQIDWSCCFDGRHCLAETWHGELLPATRRIRAALQATRAGRDVTATGLLAIPAAIALGYAFSSSGGMHVGWMPVGESELWSLRNVPSEREVETHVQMRDPAGRDLLLLVSCTQNVRNDANRLIARLPPIRAVAEVSVSSERITSADATRISEKIRAALVCGRHKEGATGTVHVLMAGPVGLAFMIGQSLNTFTNIQTYEHAAGEDPPYRAAALINE